MTRTVTAAYETERAKIATAPVYYCDFRHVKTQGDGVDYGFSRHFSSGTVASPTVTKLAYMLRVSGNTQTVEPELGRSSIGRLRLDFLDVKADGTNGEFLKYVSEGRLTLSGAHTNIVTTMTISGSTTGYPTVGTIQVTAGSGAVERIRYTGKGASTFTGCTRGVDGTTNVAYSGGEQVRNGEQIRAGQRVVLYAGYDVLTEANYMSFSKMEVVEVSLLADGLTFSVECADILRTTRKTIFLTATETNPVALTGNPLTLLLQVLISTGAGTNWSGAGTNYDVLNVNNGLAIPYQLVDIAGVESLRTSDFPSDTYTFSMTTPQLGKDFLEVEICKTTNCYPLVKQDGKISLRRYKLNVGAPTGDLLSMTHDNIRTWQWVAGYSRIINVIVFDYDWSLTGAVGAYGKREIFTQAASVAKYGKRSPLVIQSRGIRTADGGAAIALSRATEVARRFAEPPEMLALSTFYQKHPIEAGDQVPVTSTLIPNDKTGLRGLTAEVFETLDVRPNFGPEGGVDLALLWVGSLPTVAAPTSDGTTDTAPAAATIGEITLENLDTALGLETGGMVIFLEAAFTATTPKSAYRQFTTSTIENDYTLATGDVLKYDERFTATSVDTRGGLDLAITERAGTVGTGSNDATHVKLDAGASAVDSFYNGMIVRLTVGANPVQYRTVSAYVGATKVATVSAAWTNNPVDATSTFVVVDTLRNRNPNDQNGRAASPATQLGAVALDVWYPRTFTIPSQWNGKTLLSAAVGIDTAATGTTTLRVRGPHILTSAGLLRLNLFRHAYEGTGLIWVYGPGGTADQNPSGTPVNRRETGGTAQPTETVMNLAMSRGDQVENTTGGTVSTTETTIGTVTPFFGGIQDRVRITASVLGKVAITANAKGAEGGVTIIARLRKDNATGTIMDTKALAFASDSAVDTFTLTGTIALMGIDAPGLANTTKDYVLTVDRVVGTSITATSTWDELKLGALVGSA